MGNQVLEIEPWDRSRRWWGNRVSWWHAGVFVVLWLLFTSWTLLIVSYGLDDASSHLGVVAATTAGTILGPMTGAISRGFQGCCLAFSLGLLPYGLAALAVATLAQLAAPGRAAWWRVFRLILWGIGWFVWFGLGIVSFGHALS